MKTKLVFGLLLSLSLSLKLSAQSTEQVKKVQPQLTLSGWYNYSGLDFSIGFGEEHKHRLEAVFLMDQSFGAFASPGAELLYHHRLATAGNGQIFIGIGGRYYSYEIDGAGFVSVPMTYRYKFPNHPFAARARVSLLANEDGPFMLPGLGLSWVF